MVLFMTVVALVGSASVATAAPAAPQQVQVAYPAPVGFGRPGTWYHRDFQQGTETVWFFEPRGLVPNGFRASYIKVGTLPPFADQRPFAYSQVNNQLALRFPTGTQQSITWLRYDPAQDALTVNYVGYLPGISRSGSGAAAR